MMLFSFIVEINMIFYVIRAWLTIALVQNSDESEFILFFVQPTLSNIVQHPIHNHHSLKGRQTNWK